MNMIKLNCPSCNGSLELPDNLGVAHCMYCGTKILLQQTDSENEKKTLEHYLELKQVALKAENYEETLRYCNSILEIDPKNVEAWIDKAIAAFYVRSPENRYAEVKEYLKKAAEIAPDDNRIENVHKQFRALQGQWLNDKGCEHLELGLNVFKSLNHPNSIFDIGRAERVAREKSEPYFVSAMNAFMAATSFSPEDLVILKNVVNVASKINWINWSPEVNAEIERYKSKTS